MTEKPPAIFLAFVLLAVGLFPNLLLGFVDKPEEEEVIDLKTITTSTESTPATTGLHSRHPTPGN